MKTLTKNPPSPRPSPPGEGAASAGQSALPRAESSLDENVRLELSIECDSRTQAEYLAGEVVRLQTEIDQCAAERDRRAAESLEALRLEYEPKIKAKGELALQKSEAVRQWLEKHRDDVLGEKGKTFETALAKVGFRWSPPRIETAPGLDWSDVLKRLESARKKFVKLVDGTKVAFATRFVRVKKEVNRDQLKKDLLADLVDAGAGQSLGVVVKQDEIFFISAK